MGKGVAKAPRAPSKRSLLIARDVAGIDRVKAGGSWDDQGRLCALWAWLPVSCPRTKGNSKNAFSGTTKDGRTFARVTTPEGEEEHQAALVSLMERALCDVLVRRGVERGDSTKGPEGVHGSPFPKWTDARRSLVVVLPLPRSGVAETPRPSRKATLLIKDEPRRQPKVGDLGGYAKMVDDAIEAAGWVDDDVAISRHGPSSKEWVGFRMPFGQTTASDSFKGAWTHDRTLDEPGYLVGLERLS